MRHHVQVPAPVDLAPLTAPPAPAAVAAWRERAERDPALAAALAAGKGGQRGCALVWALVGSVGGMLLGVILLLSSAPWGVGVFFLLLSAGVLVWVVILPRRSHGTPWERWARLDAFARRNGFSFSPADPVPPQYQGLLFQVGTEREIEEHVVSRDDGDFVDMGTVRYVGGTTDMRVVYRWGFVAIHLDRRLPQMMLDARANDTIAASTRIPIGYARDQILHLEGDWDRHFTLYCPAEYGTDALYIFTPDLMALFIDELAAPGTGVFDAEIADDWLFVYAPRGFRLDDPRLMARLLRIVDVVGAKTRARAARYVDDRVASAAANMVAPGGRRLRRRWPIALILLSLVLVVWRIASAIAHF